MLGRSLQKSAVRGREKFAELEHQTVYFSSFIKK